MTYKKKIIMLKIRLKKISNDHQNRSCFTNNYLFIETNGKWGCEWTTLGLSNGLPEYKVVKTNQLNNRHYLK